MNSGASVVTYGLTSLTVLVIASMVGAGVFTTSGFTLGVVGSPSLVMLCWVLGGMIAICGAITYGELATLMPQSGGEYLYLGRTLHPIVGFLAGWVSLTAGFSGAIAAAAVAFETYAVPDAIRPTWLMPDMVAVGLILLCGLGHGLHAKTGKVVQNVIVGIKLVVLVQFLVTVAMSLPTHQWHFEGTGSPPPDLWACVVAVATSLVWISLSYAGFNAAVYVASESTQAQKNVPKALLLGTIGVTILYLILNLIFVTATFADNIVWQGSVAAIAANAIGGPGLEFTIRMAVSLGLLSSVSAMVMSGPRVYSRMADDGVFPPMFQSIRGGIARSVALQTAIAVGLVVLQRVLVETGMVRSSLLGLLIYLGTTLSLSSACCAATLFLPSVRRQRTNRSLFSDVAALVYVTATLAAIVILTCSHQSDGESQGVWHMAGAAVTLISGTVAWFCFRRREVA